MAATSLPPGFRFHPTDKELVGYYLRRKVDGREIELEVIPVIDLYKFEPWDLPDRSFLPKRDMEWFFFCPRDRKYPNGSRTNRATRSGYWKATGKDRKVTCQPVTALRKTLVFYRGRAPAGDRTGWVMHEYRLCEVISQGITHFVGDFALCHIMKRNEHGQKAGERKRDKTNASEDGPPNSNTAFCRNYGSIPASPPNGNANARGTQIEPVVIDQDQTSPGEAEAVLLDSPKALAVTGEVRHVKFKEDFPVGGSNGSPLMLQDHEFQASPLAFPFCTPMDFSLATPNMDLCEEAGFMMPFPSPMDCMDMCSNVMNPSFQSMQWEGVETWNLTFSPICRQASEDGIGEPASLWCLDDSGIVR